MTNIIGISNSIPLPTTLGGTGNSTGAPSGSASGDLSGSYPSPTVTKINGVTLGSTTAASGNLLIGSGTQWVTQALSGDATLSSIGVLTFNTVNSSVGTFGSSTQVGTFTVDGKGRITAASNVTISGVAPGGSASGDLSGSYPSPTVTKINGVALGATTAASGNILIGSGTQWVTNSVSGDATLSSLGALTLTTVNGNVGSFGNSTQVGAFTVNAKGLITAAGNVTISGVAPGGTAGGDLSGTYPNPTVAKVNGVSLGSTTATSGNLLIGSGTQWVTNAMSGDATISSTGALTLATVNSNVGSFGSATQVGTFTVDGTGRITAASNTTITGTSPGGTASGDLSGAYPNPNVAKINNVTLGLTTATAGNLLVGSGTQWVTRTVSGDVTINSTGVTAIGASKVTNAMLAGSIDLTTKVTGVLPVANGGTGKSSTTAFQILYSTAANTIGEITTANNGILVTGGTGVPTISSTIPAAVLANITIANSVIFTAGSSGTYTSTAGCTHIEVHLWGGGGGGGGVAGVASSAGGASGGGGGAYCFRIYPAGSYTYSVGALGAGGAAGANNGSNGTGSTFDVMSAGGGALGTAQTSGVGIAIVPGGNGGSASGGSLNFAGQGGGPGVTLSASAAFSGNGGSAGAGGGGARSQFAAAGINGNVGGLAGGGGAGAMAGNATSRAGGNGGNGLLFIIEYFNG